MYRRPASLRKKIGRGDVCTQANQCTQSIGRGATLKNQRGRSWAPFPPGGLLEYGFAGYVPLVSHNPYAIIVNSVANYRLRISHFCKCNFHDPTLVTFCICIHLIKPFIKVIPKRIGTFVTLNVVKIPTVRNPQLQEFSYRQTPEILLPHSSSSIENATPL